MTNKYEEALTKLKQKFCQEECRCYEILQDISYNFEQVEELRVEICEKKCIKTAMDFAKWLKLEDVLKIGVTF